MKLPTVPTVYYDPEINEIVLFKPDYYIFSGGEMIILNYCIESDSLNPVNIYNMSHLKPYINSYLKKSFPHLVKIGEL